MKVRTFVAAKSKDSGSKSTALPPQAMPVLQTASFPLAQMQRLKSTLGNRGLQRLHDSGQLQTKLKIGKPNSIYEKEADAMATKVLRMPEPITAQPVPTLRPKPLAESITPLVQRKNQEEEPQAKLLLRQIEQAEPQAQKELQRQQEEEPQKKPLLQREEKEDEAQGKWLIQRADQEEEPQAKTLQRAKAEEEPQPKPVLRQAEPEEQEAQTKPLLQKSEQEEEAQTKPLLQKAEQEEEAQTKAGPGITQIDDELATRIDRKRDGGRPLSEGMQTAMEDRFGADFSGVRLHTDSEAAALNKSIGARAFTLNNNIYFGAGEHNQDSSRGQELLAHELTHTVQQGAAPPQQPAIPQPVTPDAAKTGDLTIIPAVPAMPIPDAETKAEPVPGQTTKSKGMPATASIAKPGPAKKEAGKKTPAPGKKATGTKATKPKPGAATSKPPAMGKSVKKAVKKAPTDPKKDPAFQSVVANVGVAGKTLKTHEPATAKASQAQEAAVGPEDEVEGQAQANQVASMEEAKPAGFNKAAFKATLMEKIKAIAPKNLEETVDFKKSGKLDSTKQALTSEVQEGKKESAADITEKTQAQPSSAGVKPKPVVPLKPEAELPQPQIPGQEGAAPKKKTNEEISLTEESKSLDDKMAEAKITEEQLANSNEPEFQQALTAKKTAQADAKTAPKKFRSQEAGILSESSGLVKSNIAKEIGMMHTGRTQAFGKVAGKQVSAKGKDEVERQKVTAKIKGFYSQTKTEVETILDDLDTKVINAFDKGASKAQEKFENYVDQRMEAYKDKRYSGLIGAARWLKDKLFGMPDDVNAFYSEGRDLFIQEMDKVIDGVIEIIASELKKAKKAIEKGKKKISDYVQSLPQSLQKVGQQASEEIQSEFDGLENQIAQKQDELVNTLAQKYVENVKKVDARIEKMKEANRGLIAKAFDFIVGVIKTIIEIGKKLLSLLKKIAEVVWDVLSDPIGFLGNLIDAIKLGFNMFVDRIGTHLKQGLIAWLTGSLGEANIEIPDKFDLPGIFKLVLSILGFTWDYVRGKAVKLFGEPVVNAMEKGAEIFMVIKNEGIAGLWKYLQDQFNDLKETVMDAIQEMIVVEVIKAGIKWLLGLFNPVGAFIKAAMAIYEVVKFFIQNAAKIIDFINAVFDAIGAIAKGSIKSAAKLVENALAKSIPLIIGFLASLLGISGLVKKVQKIIQSIRKRIDKAITKLLMKVKKTFKGILQKVGKLAGTAKEKGKAAVAKVIQWWNKKKTVKAAGKKIDIYFEPVGKKVKLMVKASPKKGFIDYLNQLELKAEEKSGNDFQEAVSLGNELDNKQMPNKETDVTKTYAEGIIKKMNQFANLIKKLNEKTGGQIPISLVRFGSLDKNQGATEMNAEILSSKHPGGSHVQDMPPIMKNLGKLGKTPGRPPYYIQGHLLNNNLGGPGKRWNLTPITKAANSDHSQKIEEPLKTVVKNDGVVRYGVKVLTGSHAKRKGFDSLERIVTNEKLLAKTGPLKDLLKYEYGIMKAELELAKGFSIKAFQLDTDSSGKWTVKKSNPAIKESYTVVNETGGDQGMSVDTFNNKSIETIEQEVTSAP